MHRFLQIGIADWTLNQVRALALATISVSLTLSGSSAAEAACANWDLTNQTLWGAGQTNGYTLGLTFKQSGGNLWGDGYYFGHDGPRVPGTLSGSIHGNEFQFTMTWNNGGKGIYTGFIADDGTIRGNTRDARNRNSRAIWSVNKWQKARCLG